MGSPELGVAVVGCGRAGMVHARNFAAGVGGAALVALADSSAEALAAAGRELDCPRTYAAWADAIADEAVQAVVVAAPTEVHKDVVIAAARAGKHVLCEKPMALRAADGEAMIQAADRARAKLQVGFMRRFDKTFLAAKEAIERGDIGQVVCVKSLTRGPSVPKRWQCDVAKSAGPLAEVSSHDIDTVRWLTGSEFREVYAIAGNYRCPDVRAEFPDFYDNVLLVASMENGMQGLVEGAVSVRYGYDARVEVVGTRGALFVGGPGGGRLAVASEAAGRGQPVVRSWRELFAEAYAAEAADFVACVREDRPPRAGGRDGLAAVRVVEAGNRSIRSGRPVRLTPAEAV